MDIRQANRKLKAAGWIIIAGAHAKKERNRKLHTEGSAHARITDFYDLNDDEELGRGAYGVVVPAVQRSTGREYCCKTLSKLSIRSEEESQIVRDEVRIMQKLTKVKHENIFKIYSKLYGERLV